MATITNLQGSTQIWNSDEIINQNFQNINNAMVEKTGNQTIAGDKTFTAVEMIHDVTNNTDNPNMRRVVKKTKVKNVWDAGGVEFVEFVDADNSIVWYRKRALRWYLKKRADWTIVSYNDLFSIEYDTYDWDVTYTSRTSIKTNSLYFNDQNRTGAWTSYTPTVSWDSWTVTSYSSQLGRYYKLWKNVFYEVNIIVSNKWTLSWLLSYSLPLTCANTLTEMIQTWWVYTPWGIVNKWLPVVYNWTIWHFLVWVDTGALQRSSYTNWDVIRVQGRYTTA